MARAPCSTTTSERTNIAAGLSEATNSRCSGRSMVAAGADADHRAVAHQRGVERDGDVARRRELAEMRESAPDRRRPARRRASRPQARAPDRQCRTVPATNAPSTKTRRRVSTSPSNCAGVLGARLGGGIGRARQRLGVAHQRAQIGVFPFLDAAMRQAFSGEHIERGLALRRDRTVAGQPSRACAKACASAVSAAVLMTSGRPCIHSRASRRCHAAASSWYSA